MIFRLITLDGQLVMEDFESIHLTTVAGEITVLPHHEPMMALLLSGPVEVVFAGDPGKQHTWYCGAGLLWVRPDEVQPIVRAAE